MKDLRRYLPLAPALAVVLALSLIPTIWIVRASFHYWVFGLPGKKFIGWENYTKIFSDPTFWKTIKTTFLFVLPSISVEALIGLVVALLLNGEIRGRGIITGLLIIPMVIADSMVGLTWRLYYSEYGIYSYITRALFGISIDWHTVKWALPAIIIGDIWRWTPFFILIILSGLQALPKDFYEAARVDGASSFQIFHYITLPLITPLILIGLILRFIDASKLFGMIFTMYEGGPGNATEILPISIYRTTLLARNIGEGMAKAMILVLLIMATGVIFIYYYNRLRTRRE